MPVRRTPTLSTIVLAAVVACALGVVSRQATAGGAGTEAAAAAAAAATALAQEAVAANPTVEARRSLAEQLRARAAVAGAWPDPVVGLEYSSVPVDSWSLSDHPMAGLQLRVQQTLHPPAWSRQQREVIGLRADAADAAVAETSVALQAAVEGAWWALTRTRLLRSVTQQHLARTDDLLEAVRARYEVGAAGQSAILRLSVLRDRLADDLHDYRRTDDELSATLDTALSRAALAAYETPAQVEPVTAPSPRAWGELAAQGRPELARLEAEQAAAEAAAGLARTDGLPDPAVWAAYRLRIAETPTDPGTDLVAIGISVPIPTGSGRRAKGEAAGWHAAAQGASHQQDALRDRIDGDMRAVLARWSRAEAKVATYDSQLLPAATATLDATLSDFAVGRADFSSLFDAEITLLDLERARIVAATETWLQRAQAFAVLGTHPQAASR